MKWEYRFMKFKKIHSGLIALGLCCSLLLQTPVLAAEETTDTVAASAISTNEYSRMAAGSGYHIHCCRHHGRQHTTQHVYAKNMDQVLYPGATVKVMTTLLDTGKYAAFRPGHYDCNRCIRGYRRRSQYLCTD